jgi:hypothetical protein
LRLHVTKITLPPSEMPDLLTRLANTTGDKEISDGSDARSIGEREEENEFHPLHWQWNRCEAYGAKVWGAE